jgi:hypothetical protein
MKHLSLHAKLDELENTPDEATPNQVRDKVVVFTHEEPDLNNRCSQQNYAVEFLFNCRHMSLQLCLLNLCFLVPFKGSLHICAVKYQIIVFVLETFLFVIV